MEQEIEVTASGKLDYPDIQMDLVDLQVDATQTPPN